MILDYHFVATILVITSCLIAPMLANQNICNCRCWDKNHVCDEIKKLKTIVDDNTAYNRKWSPHYNFLRRFHHSWQDEVAQEVKQQLKDNPSWYQSSNTKLDEIHKMVLEYREQNLELQRKMTGVESSLQAAEDRAQKLESELKSEREARNLLETEYRGQELMLEGKNIGLKNRISALEEDLNKKVNTTQSKLDKEIEARSKLEDELDEFRQTLQLFDPEDLKKLKNASQQFKREIQRLEKNDKFRGRKINTNEDDIRNLQFSLGKMQTSMLKATNALRSYVPRSVGDNMIKELSVKLAIPTEYLELDYTNSTLPTPSNPYAIGSYGRYRSGRYTEMNSKLEDLDSKVKTLNNSIGKAMSNLKVLENKYKVAWTTVDHSKKHKKPKNRFEVEASHEKNLPRRTFDPMWDP